MFKFIKTAKLQIAVFVLAIGGAFATNAMSGSATTLVNGYQKIDDEGLDCRELPVVCSTIPNDSPCTYALSATEVVEVFHKEIVCTIPLFEPMP